MPARPRLGLAKAVAVTALTALAAEAHAQQLSNAPVDLELFRPAMDSKGFITLNSSAVLGQGDFSFGLVTSYARKPLTLTGNQMFGGKTNTFSVDTLVVPSLQAAVGFTKFSHFGLELGVILPLAVVSGVGNPTDPGANPNTNLDDHQYTFTKQGIGDIQIHPKIRLMNATRNGLGFAIIPSLILPTGDKNSFMGEGQTIFQPTAVLDTELGYLGRFRAAVNAGMRIRSHQSQFVDNAASFPRTYTVMPMMSVPEETNAGIQVGSEFIGGRGLSYGIVPQKFDIVGEIYGALGTNSFKIDATGATSKMGPSAEAIAGIKLYLARNSFFEIGGGYRVADGYGGAQPRAFIGFIFEPSIGDRDGDGYKDDVDQCPDDPEDFDDFEDADGCPEPDNDKDGILDVDDKCPNDPETYNGFEDADGCPDKGRVIVHKGKLEILDKIYFETDKDEIKPVSFPLLDAIAATINGNPQIQLIEIQGHADERGDDAHNLDLTERRAHSVRVALEQRNVLPSRLKSHGYGETKPICNQHNEDCWSKNRRVEFVIKQRK